ncbi:hypothetical protein K443DRAFT_81614 [Laccaria amethystina LaAM-08-1]|uniref:PHD finger protein 10 n=1 Tax=Laccaria amethystina LaAM-08-1 TaxID=1095629 RepID=A0A0C9XCZ7_9AGAR|nr:hypothetical protein K443DRAFT_81614 [Laccaria amethystina LaAM-08-1]
MATCDECGRSGHPSCMELAEIGHVLISYPWKCIECKNCELCKEKGDDVSHVFVKMPTHSETLKRSGFCFVTVAIVVSLCGIGTHRDSCVSARLASGLYGTSTCGTT